jgi:hypothetical protein
MGHIGETGDEKSRHAYTSCVAPVNVKREYAVNITRIRNEKRAREVKMLDLSMYTTEECVYPSCEGG